MDLSTDDDAIARACLEMNQKIISQAVGAYPDDKLSQLTFLRKCSALQQRVKVRLQEKAEGSFLWASFAIKDLQNLSSKPKNLRRVRDKQNPLNIFEKLPRDLEQYYYQMMRKIKDLQEEENNEALYLAAVSALQTVSLAHRPLHLLELGALSDIPEDISEDIESIKAVATMCGFFLLFDEGCYVHLVRHTAREFLVRETTVTIFPSGLADIHSSIFSRSLDVISRILRRDIYDLRQPGLSIDEVEARCPDLLAATRYSCVFWADRLSDSQYESNFSDRERVEAFLRHSFLNWLEALSPMRSMTDGIAAVTKLEAFLEASSDFEAPRYRHSRQLQYTDVSSDYVERISTVQSSSRRSAVPSTL